MSVPSPAFTTAAWERTGAVRAAIDRLPLLLDLENGDLPHETFRHYLTQDAHYLAGFGRALAACGAQCGDAEEMGFWTGSAQGTVVVEQELHARYDADPANVPPSPTCTAYTSYLLALSASGCYPELAAGVLPCFWIYDDVGTRLKQPVGDVDVHPYGEWIGTYGDPDFAATTQSARDVVDSLAERADAATLERMHTAFYRATQYEWMFWDAAHRHETWPV